MPEQPNPQDTAFIPFDGGAFCFDCHRDVTCFNECCAKLRLVLTPYDILRIKNRLGTTSGQFLDDYTETVWSDHNRFPMARLKMTEGRGRACPFVTPRGCAIYEDRPVACRIYPLGRASKQGGCGAAPENLFIVKEPHCRGFQERRSWKLADWLRDQGVLEYDAMNRPWLEIVTSTKALSKAQASAQLQVFFMVSYDVDKFRRLAFSGGFFDRFLVDAHRVTRMRNDDAALMTFGFTWLRFALFGEPVPELKTASTSLG